MDRLTPEQRKTYERLLKLNNRSKADEKLFKYLDDKIKNAVDASSKGLPSNWLLDLFRQWSLVDKILNVSKLKNVPSCAKILIIILFIVFGCLEISSVIIGGVSGSLDIANRLLPTQTWTPTFTPTLTPTPTYTPTPTLTLTPSPTPTSSQVSENDFEKYIPTQLPEWFTVKNTSLILLLIASGIVIYFVVRNVETWLEMRDQKSSDVSISIASSVAQIDSDSYKVDAINSAIQSLEITLSGEDVSRILSSFNSDAYLVEALEILSSVMERPVSGNAKTKILSYISSDAYKADALSILDVGYR